MEPRFINGTGARGSQSASAGESGTARRARRRAPGLRKRAAPRRARRGEREDPARAPARGEARERRGRQSRSPSRLALEAGTPARGLSGPTDFLTDRRRHTPLHPTPPRPHPQRRRRLPLMTSATPSFSTSFPPPPLRLPRRQLPWPGRGAPVPGRACRVRWGTFLFKQRSSPCAGRERCRGSFSREDRGMRRVRPGRVAFVKYFFRLPPSVLTSVVPKCPSWSSDSV